MTEKFSPGPWSRDSFGSVVDATGRKVKVQGVSLPMLSDDEAEANADLFAAAPELLGALEKYINAGIGNSTDFALQHDAYSKAYVAIKQARGEQ